MQGATGKTLAGILISLSRTFFRMQRSRYGAYRFRSRLPVRYSGERPFDMSDAPPRIPRHLWLIAAVTGSGAFMAMLDSTVVHLALDTIGEEFNVPIEKAQWIITGYLIALAVSLPLTGWLGRRFGQGRIWAVSVAGFCLTSLLCACAGSLWQLLVARIAQGIAGGVMVPSGQAVIASCADRRQLGRLMGIVGFAVALGPAIGPGFGGLLVEHFSWRWLFGINVIVGVASLVLAKKSVPKGEPVPNSSIDKRGAFLAILGIPLLLFGITEIATSDNDHAFVVAALGGILTLLFVWHALKASAPLVRIKLLAIPRLAAGATTAWFTGTAMYGGLLVLPLFFQAELGISISGSGVLFLLMGLGSACVLPLAGSLTDRFGAGVVSLAGCMLLIAGTVPFLLPELLSEPLLVIVLLLRGAGLPLAQMPAMTAVYTAVDKRDTGDAAVLVNITQRLGGALGTISVAIVLDQFGPSHSGEEFILAFGLLTALAIGALCSASSLLRSSAYADSKAGSQTS